VRLGWVAGGLFAATCLVPTAAAQAGSPAGPVPVARLAARRAALLDSLGRGVAVIRSATKRSIEGDYPQDSDYRENNNFFYLTGLEEPGGRLVLVAQDSAPDREILYLPARDTALQHWSSPRLGPGEEARTLTGIADIRPAERADSEIARLPGAEVPEAELEAAVAALRQVKDGDELVRLRRAIGITTDAIGDVMVAARPGMWEYELESGLEARFRREGAERVGFPSIVGSGPNSTTLHYDTNRRLTAPGDLVVLDVGAEYGYYSADVTRTFPISGRFSERQRRLYELVLATQQAAIDSVRPGTDVATLNRIARAYMRTHSGSLCGELTCDRYFPHGLSHWLGMDVHDVGRYATPLAPGMVLTVEPGIYLPAESLGIRIEDDVLVTPGGHQVLSTGAPRGADEVERAMRTP
jgi:Xaa-Pro aminopeptidase